MSVIVQPSAFYWTIDSTVNRRELEQVVSKNKQKQHYSGLVFSEERKISFSFFMVQSLYSKTCALKIVALNDGGTSGRVCMCADADI